MMGRGGGGRFHWHLVLRARLRDHSLTQWGILLPETQLWNALLSIHVQEKSVYHFLNFSIFLQVFALKFPYMYLVSQSRERTQFFCLGLYHDFNPLRNITWPITRLLMDSEWSWNVPAPFPSTGGAVAVSLILSYRPHRTLSSNVVISEHLHAVTSFQLVFSNYVCVGYICYELSCRTVKGTLPHCDYNKGPGSEELGAKVYTCWSGSGQEDEWWSVWRINS